MSQYVKFTYQRARANIGPFNTLAELNACRRKLLDGAPTTSKRVPYGTCEMAREIIRLFTETDVRSRKIFVMAGHEDGIVTLGKNFEEAFAVLLRQRKASIACVENGFHERIP